MKPTSKNELKLGVILNYTTIIITVLVGLILTPFIINNLGDAEYGLYTLMGAFVGYITVLDFGLNNTIIRFVARYRTKEDKIGEENFLATVMSIYGIISIIILVVGMILYLNLDTIFSNSLTIEELEKAKLMFIILIFNIAFTLPGGSFKAISSAYEHFVFPRVAEIIKYIIRSLLVVSLLLYGGDSIGLVIIDTIMNLLIISVNTYYVFRVLKVKFKFHSFKFHFVKEVFSYSIWIFVFSIVGLLQWQFGQVALGVLLDTTSVAIYAVGVMLGTYYGTFSSAISSVFMPKATKMIVNKATDMELTLMMVKIGRFSLLVLLLILGNFLLFGKQFILLWVGNSYHLAWLIALTIMIVYTIPLVQSFANIILEAKALFKYKAIVYISSIGFGAFWGAMLVPEYGIYGMTVGTSIGWLLSIIIMNIYYNKVIGLNIFIFFKMLLSKILPAYIFILIIGYFINYIEGSSWTNFSIKVLLFSIIYIFIMSKFGMKDEEKNTFTSLIPFKRKNNAEIK